jgi:hypothetical protein
MPDPQATAGSVRSFTTAHRGHDIARRQAWILRAKCHVG